MVKGDPTGIAISECDVREVEQGLIDYRNKANDPELWGFHIVRRGDEVHIIRSPIGVRRDGAYRPLED